MATGMGTTILVLPLKDRLAEPLDLPSLLRVSARRLKQACPGLGILDLDRLFSSLDTHVTLFVHGDSVTGFDAGAPGNKQCRETWVSRLEDLAEKWLAG